MHVIGTFEPARRFDARARPTAKSDDTVDEGLCGHLPERARVEARMTSIPPDPPRPHPPRRHTKKSRSGRCDPSRGREAAVGTRRRSREDEKKRVFGRRASQRRVRDARRFGQAPRYCRTRGTSPPRRQKKLSASEDRRRRMWLWNTIGRSAGSCVDHASALEKLGVVAKFNRRRVLYISRSR